MNENESNPKRTHYTIDIALEDDGKKVVLAGYVDTIRKVGKNFIFIMLRDEKGVVQITLKQGPVQSNLVELASNLTPESIILVEGFIRKTDQTIRGVEITPSFLNILNLAKTPLPIDFHEKQGSILYTRLDWRPLDLRGEEQSAIIKIQSKLLQGIYEWLIENDFLLVNTPCLIAYPSESGADMFSIDYFGKKAYLRQDPQLHRQLTILSGFEKIVDIGPSWRAEPSHTPRHLCEHRGIALEVAYINDEKDIMRIEENLIVSAINRVKNDCGKELGILKKEINVPKTPFPEINYPKIYKLLNALGKKIEFGAEHDWESEKLLAEYIKLTFDSDFFFINRFPFLSKPFYVMRVDEEPQWCRSIDLIYKGLEQSSGGQRENRYEKIIEQLKEKKLNLDNFDWFTKFFKYGAPPHGGFNLGLERFTMQLLDLPNIREATLFPRTPERSSP